VAKYLSDRVKHVSTKPNVTHIGRIGVDRDRATSCKEAFGVWQVGGKVENFRMLRLAGLRDCFVLGELPGRV
jgi:hypothetical protein